MPEVAENESVVRYQFQIDDDIWERWKETVPRTKSLEKRLIELIEADTDSRVINEPIDFEDCPWCGKPIETADEALWHLENCPEN